jgi:hypothetical protein
MAMLRGLVNLSAGPALASIDVGKKPSVAKTAPDITK